MRDIPLDVFLSFPLPNYKNPPTRGPALVIVNAILIALVVVAVLLRLYARLFIKRWFGSDDIFIILALVCSPSLAVSVAVAGCRVQRLRDVRRHVFAGSRPTDCCTRSRPLV